MITPPRKSWFALLPLAVACAVFTYGTTSASGTLAAHFINVGQGDSCWLHLPNGDDILVDGGKPHAGPTIAAYLSQHGVSDIELLVATHGDADHIGGLLDVLASIPVEQAWLDSQTCTTGTCEDLHQALADHAVVTATVRMGESYPWGEVTALVLNHSEGNTNARRGRRALLPPAIPRERQPSWRLSGAFACDMILSPQKPNRTPAKGSRIG